MPETELPKLTKGSESGRVAVPPLPDPPYARPELKWWQRQALLPIRHWIDGRLIPREKLQCHCCGNVIGRIADGLLYEAVWPNPGRLGRCITEFPEGTTGIKCRYPHCGEPLNLVSLAYLPGLAQSLERTGQFTVPKVSATPQSLAIARRQARHL